MPLGLTSPDNVRLEVAMHVPGLVITGLAFFDNVFIPLSDTMPTIGRWSPAYDITALARCPLINGMDIGGGHDSLRILPTIPEQLPAPVRFSPSRHQRRHRGDGRTRMTMRTLIAEDIDLDLAATAM
ncbi:hypothetical protein [Cutibacterium avidum]|uniref:hypothetical protein n=1 Tax=Cutibacterium avidum TaxID=33010 RepID=UPI00083E863F|nr:hypothetical protein [Cutibacterium avidum]AOG28377.1 hypothetical protein BFS79_07480 [Cutibacterium avidum]